MPILLPQPWAHAWQQVVSVFMSALETSAEMLVYQGWAVQALGYKMPMFGHVSLILAPDRSKLSKRHGATSVGQVSCFIVVATSSARGFNAGYCFCFPLLLCRICEHCKFSMDDPAVGTAYCCQVLAE